MRQARELQKVYEGTLAKGVMAQVFFFCEAGLTLALGGNPTLSYLCLLRE